MPLALTPLCSQECHNPVPNGAGHIRPSAETQNIGATVLDAFPRWTMDVHHSSTLAASPGCHCQFASSGMSTPCS